METKAAVAAANPAWAWPVSIGLAILAAGIMFVVLTGKSFPVLSSPKAAFYILWVIGLLMSIASGMRDMKGTVVPFPGIFTTLLMVGGMLAFALLIVMLFGIKIPWVREYPHAFTLLSGIIAVKWVLTHIGLLLPH
jgi:hypothetical protein